MQLLKEAGGTTCSTRELPTAAAEGWLDGVDVVFDSLGEVCVCARCVYMCSLCMLCIHVLAVYTPHLITTHVAPRGLNGSSWASIVNSKELLGLCVAVRRLLRIFGCPMQQR